MNRFHHPWPVLTPSFAPFVVEKLRISLAMRLLGAFPTTRGSCSSTTGLFCLVEQATDALVTCDLDQNRSVCFDSVPLMGKTACDHATRIFPDL